MDWKYAPPAPVPLSVSSVAASPACYDQEVDGQFLDSSDCEDAGASADGRVNGWTSPSPTHVPAATTNTTAAAPAGIDRDVTADEKNAAAVDVLYRDIRRLLTDNVSAALSGSQANASVTSLTPTTTTADCVPAQLLPAVNTGVDHLSPTSTSTVEDVEHCCSSQHVTSVTSTDLRPYMTGGGGSDTLDDCDDDDEDDDVACVGESLHPARCGSVLNELPPPSSTIIFADDHLSAAFAGFDLQVETYTSETEGWDRGDDDAATVGAASDEHSAAPTSTSTSVDQLSAVSCAAVAGSDEALSQRVLDLSGSAEAVVERQDACDMAANTHKPTSVRRLSFTLESPSPIVLECYRQREAAQNASQTPSAGVRRRWSKRRPDKAPCDGRVSSAATAVDELPIVRRQTGNTNDDRLPSCELPLEWSRKLARLPAAVANEATARGRDVRDGRFGSVPAAPAFSTGGLCRRRPPAVVHSARGSPTPSASAPALLPLPTTTGCHTSPSDGSDAVAPSTSDAPASDSRSGSTCWSCDNNNDDNDISLSSLMGDWSPAVTGEEPVKFKKTDGGSSGSSCSHTDGTLTPSAPSGAVDGTSSGSALLDQCAVELRHLWTRHARRLGQLVNEQQRQRRALEARLQLCERRLMARLHQQLAQVTCVAGRSPPPSPHGQLTEDRVVCESPRRRDDSVHTDESTNSSRLQPPPPPRTQSQSPRAAVKVSRCDQLLPTPVARRQYTASVGGGGRMAVHLPAAALTPAMHERFCRVTAAVRGYLTRRLLRTDKVQTIIYTAREAMQCAVRLQREAEAVAAPDGGVSAQDLQLYERLIKQVYGACFSLHRLCVAAPVAQRMAVIAADRHMQQQQQSSASSSWSAMSNGSGGGSVPHLSKATLAALQRKRTRLSAGSPRRGVSQRRAAPPPPSHQRHSHNARSPLPAKSRRSRHVTSIYATAVTTNSDGRLRHDAAVDLTEYHVQRRVPLHVRPWH